MQSYCDKCSNIHPIPIGRRCTIASSLPDHSIQPDSSDTDPADDRINSAQPLQTRTSSKTSLSSTMSEQEPKRRLRWESHLSSSPGVEVQAAAHQRWKSCRHRLSAGYEPPWFLSTPPPEAVNTVSSNRRSKDRERPEAASSTPHIPPDVCRSQAHLDPPPLVPIHPHWIYSGGTRCCNGRWTPDSLTR